MRHKAGKKLKIDTPFDVTYTITFSGRTQADGVSTVTAQIIRDKVILVLEELISKGQIRDYTISAMLNNIEAARGVMKKSKRK